MPPGYTYPAIALGYRNGPSPQDVRLAQPADLEAVQAEPPEHAPQSLAGLEEELDCQVPVMPLTELLPLKEVEPGEEERMNERALQLREEVEVAAAVNYVPEEEGADKERSAEADVLSCPPVVSSVCETASCPVPLVTEQPSGPHAVITLEEEDDEEVVGEESQVLHDQKVNLHAEESELPAIIDLDPASPAVYESPCSQPEAAKESEHENKMTPEDATVEFLCPSPASTSACSNGEEAVAVPCKPYVPCYWSLELLIAAAFCTDVPPFPLFSNSTPSTVLSQCAPNKGMELLSELADLELQQMKHICGKTPGE